MAKWWLKAAVHKSLAAVPGAFWLNEQIQLHVTRSLDLTTSRFHNKLNDCQHHLRHYREFAGNSAPPARVVELGSGWYPVTPLGMYLHGAEEVITCDIAPLLKPPRVRLAMQKIVEYHDQQLLRNFWPDVQSARIEQIRELLADPNVHSTNELLNPLGIRVLVCDAQELPLETASVDLVSSYGVLMHIAPPVLVRVLLQFNRVLRFTGVTSHWIDLTDLYHWSDASLSPLNFLRYSDSAWRFWNDPLVPTNRLRLPAYRELFTQAGFQLAEVENRRGEERDLDRVPLDPQFAEIERDDLLVLDTWLAGRPNENLSEGKSREIREVSVTN